MSDAIHRDSYDLGERDGYGAGYSAGFDAGLVDALVYVTTYLGEESERRRKMHAEFGGGPHDLIALRYVHDAMVRQYGDLVPPLRDRSQPDEREAGRREGMAEMHAIAMVAISKVLIDWPEDGHMEGAEAIRAALAQVQRLEALSDPAREESET